jgi:hypothetical protein
MFLRRALLALLASCACAGCGETEADTAGGGGQQAGSGGGGGGEDVGPRTPILDTVAALHGALHLFWTHEREFCEEVEAERKTSTEPYGVLFVVPGHVEDLADDDATDPSVTYTYRLRCKKNGVYSPYSNEDARSPMPVTDP